MVPVYLLHPEGARPAQPAATEPSACICYTIARNGIFKLINNPFYTAKIKVDGIGFLDEAKENVEIHVPKLPLCILQSAEAFFADVYQQHKSEAIVMLFAHPLTREWLVEVPRQEVVESGLHVAYDPRSVNPPEGFEPFGTIHSHAHINAFHSGTDDEDEVCSDGLHITIGNLDAPARTYSARWMLAGKAFKVTLADVIETPVLAAANPAWLERVHPKPQRAALELFDNPSGVPAGNPSEYDVPAHLQEEYNEYMYEMHERFLDRNCGGNAHDSVR